MPRLTSRQSCNSIAKGKNRFKVRKFFEGLEEEKIMAMRINVHTFIRNVS